MSENSLENVARSSLARKKNILDGKNGEEFKLSWFIGFKIAFCDLLAHEIDAFTLKNM